jgi:hypothetical protein
MSRGTRDGADDDAALTLRPLAQAYDPDPLPGGVR